MIIKDGQAQQHIQRIVETAFLNLNIELEKNGVKVKKIESGINGEDFRNGCITVMVKIEVV